MKAVFGVGATNQYGRLAASLGGLSSIDLSFQSAVDIPCAGVLLALPALIANGLFSNLDSHFKLPRGYYGLESIFLLLSLLSLARIKTVEELRYCPPGEWGKLLGLDRIPEARTLRERIKHLSEYGEVRAWSSELCKAWMESEHVDSSGLFYIDGHVRVYNGEQTQLPKHYVTREKLCLRATVDYWVNALGGNPFFYINKAVDPGLLSVLESEIVPQIESNLASCPYDPTIAKPSKPLHQFTLLFDREGYSPDFMKRMSEKRIACITYNKYPKEDWSGYEFVESIVKTTAGNITAVKLAERGVQLSNKLWVREIRRLNNDGHQTSILSTDYHSDFSVITSEISDRWGQENYFKYMRQHYNLDRLVSYSLEEIDESIMVVNPAYRKINSDIRKLNGKQSRQLAEFVVINLNSELQSEQVEAYECAKALLKDEIDARKIQLAELKAQRSKIQAHILIKDLPKEQQFAQLATPAKYFLDTIKMIAYRAETAMVNIIREVMSRVDDGRSLLRSIYSMEADLILDEQSNELTVKLHYPANHAEGKIIAHLCDELSSAEIEFPGTKMKVIYKLGTS
jgi:hypothetical protein